MNDQRRRLACWLLVFTVSLTSFSGYALTIEPGVGASTKLTNNARKSRDNRVTDLVSSVYAGLGAVEDEGALVYSANGSVNSQSYLKGTYENKNYFNLGANSNWAIVKDRLNWYASDRYTQTSVNSLAAVTPNNLQNTNIFITGLKLKLLSTGRNRINLVPQYSHYYYQSQKNDNAQKSVNVTWAYAISERLNIGLAYNDRNIDYTDPSLVDSRFSTIMGQFNGETRRSRYSINPGLTKVNRSNGSETQGFSGDASYDLDLTSRSGINARASTSLTDTSSLAAQIIETPFGPELDFQNASDVIRNTFANLSYVRDDSTLKTNIFMRYQEVTYSDRPLDRIIRSFGMKINRPVNEKMTSGAILRYRRIYQIDNGRLDNNYLISGVMGYQFSKKLKGRVDLSYQFRKSNNDQANYNELSIFASLVYGFGQARRP